MISINIDLDFLIWPPIGCRTATRALVSDRPRNWSPSSLQKPAASWIATASNPAQRHVLQMGKIQFPENWISFLFCVCLRVQVVYMYESESHTLEIDYGRIKVLYNNVYPVIIVKSCWGFWKKRYFTTRLCGWRSANSSSIPGSNFCVTLETFSVCCWAPRCWVSSKRATTSFPWLSDAAVVVSMGDVYSRYVFVLTT